MEAQFATWYKAVSLKADTETEAKRWQAVEALAKTFQGSQRDDLLRLFFGLVCQDRHFLEKMRQEVLKYDQSLGQQNIDAELRVIAGAALDYMMYQTGNIPVALAILSAACKGLRAEPAVPEIVARAGAFLVKRALQLRSSQNQTRKPLARQGVDDSIKKLAAAYATNTAAEIAQHNEAALNAIVTVANGLKTEDDALALKVDLLGEELDMLWWLFGGASELLNQSIEKLTPSNAAVSAGVELAGMIRTPPGPLAIEPLIKRALTARAAEELKLSEVINELAPQLRRQLADTVRPRMDADLLPLHFMCAKYEEAHGDKAWISVVKQNGIDVSRKLVASNIGLQALQEELYVRCNSSSKT
jgi:hypothetical protein